MEGEIQGRPQNHALNTPVCSTEPNPVKRWCACGEVVSAESPPSKGPDQLGTWGAEAPRIKRAVWGAAAPLSKRGYIYISSIC